MNVTVVQSANQSQTFGAKRVNIRIPGKNYRQLLQNVGGTITTEGATRVVRGNDGICLPLKKGETDKEAYIRYTKD